MIEGSRGQGVRPAAGGVDAQGVAASRRRRSSDIMDRGIMLAGGGSLLRGLPERLRRETQIAVQLAESPLTCVAAGSGMYLDEIDSVAHSKHRPRVRGRSQGPRNAQSVSLLRLAGNLWTTCSAQRSTRND